MGSFRQELDGHDRDCCTHNPSGAAVVSPAQKLCVSRRPKDKQHSGGLVSSKSHRRQQDEQRAFKRKPQS